MLRKILQIVATICHLFVNIKLVNRLNDIKTHFYTQWLRNDFAKCGTHCVFQGFSVLYGTKNIYLGDQIYIGKDVVWEVINYYEGQTFSPRLSVGDDTGFGDSGHITCCNRIEIGRGVSFGRKVFISDNSHGAVDPALMNTPVHKRPLISKGPVVIEDNVWVGEMVCILPGVTIGKGSIIGANAVVTHDIPPYSVAVGNPARVIKHFEA